jgi:single-stranded-DNA-specific exonuclease
MDDQSPISDPKNYLGIKTSVSGRNWHDRALAMGCDDFSIRQIEQALRLEPGVTPQLAEPLARAIAGRGVKLEDLETYLRPSLKALFPEPDSFLDMPVLVFAILESIEQQQKVVVFADYDVDGATSAALLVRWYRALGHEIDIYVPDRVKEGYGPSVAAFDHLKALRADLVITVDCGASAYSAIAHAAAIDLNVVVIDHHLMREDPPKCRAVVNPNRPGCGSGQGNLAAAGVVFVVLAALNRAAEARGWFKDRPKPDLLAWLDLGALGAICDVTALTGFNRALAAQGLKVMSKLQNIGIKALLDVAGGKNAVSGEALSVFHAGFIIGPRINAGGRVGRSDLGVRLLATEDEDEAKALALELDALNLNRRDVEAQVLDEAIALMEGEGGLKRQDPVIIVANDSWHPGVIGIVAGRLKERWHRPVIVIGFDPVTGIGKGSGRSCAGINLGQAVSAAFEAGVILAGGGHFMAAGLTVMRDKLIDLQGFINAHILAHTSLSDRQETMFIDASLSFAAAKRELIDGFNVMAPFGQGNLEPVFAFSHVRVIYASALKGGHVRCELMDDQGIRLKAIAWRVSDMALGQALLRPSGLLHIAGKLKPDDYMGRKGVQLEIEDIVVLSEIN